MSYCNWRNAISSDHIQILTRRIAQLEAKLWAARQQSLAQRQRLVQKYGREVLALIDDPNTRAGVTDIVQKVVFQDEEGNVVSQNRRFVSRQNY